MEKIRPLALNYPVTFVPGSARCSSALCLFLLFLVIIFLWFSSTLYHWNICTMYEVLHKLPDLLYFSLHAFKPCWEHDIVSKKLFANMILTGQILCIANGCAYYSNHNGGCVLYAWRRLGLHMTNNRLPHAHTFSILVLSMSPF